MRDRAIHKGKRFVLTGIIVNVTLYGFMALLLFFDVDYRLATTVVYALGMLWGYLQNRLWSWQSKAPGIRSAWRYILVYGAYYVVHLSFVMLLVEVFSIPPLAAVLMSVAVLIVPVFIILDRFVFCEADDATPTS